MVQTIGSYYLIWQFNRRKFDMWNCYDRTLTNFPRTNNVSEGSNNAIRAHFGCSNPTIWSCLSRMKELQSGTDLNLTQFYTYRWSKPTVARQVLQRNDRIRSMVADYDRTDLLNYTRRLGYNFWITVWNIRYYVWNYCTIEFIN